MTAKLPPKWVPINLMQLNETQLRHVQAYAETFALQSVRNALEPVGELLDALEAEASAKLSMENAVENFTNAQPEIDIAAKSMARASEAAKRVRALLKEYGNE